METDQQQQEQPQNQEITTSQQQEQIKKNPTLEKLKNLKLERTLQTLFKLNHPLLNLKHESCKHPNGCLTQLTDISLKGFLIGYTIKSLLTLISSLLRNKKKLPIYSIIFHSFFNKPTMKFASTPFVYNFVLQFSTCLFKWNRNCKKDSENPEKKDQKRDQMDAFWAGYLAGFFALMTKPQKDRSIWSVFLLTRALECIYNNMVNKGYLPRSKMNYVWIFAFMWGFLGINSAQEQGNLPKTFLKFENNMMNLCDADITRYRSEMMKCNRYMFLKYGAKAFDPADIFPKPTKQVELFKMFK